MADHESITVGANTRLTIFHGFAKIAYNTLASNARCSYKLFPHEMTAGDAIRLGLRPCRKCFPYDPLSTWKVEA